MNDRFYGLDGQNTLDNSVDDVVEKILDGTSIMEDPIQWPIVVLEYRTRVVDPKALAVSILDILLEKLDEEFGDPDAEHTSPFSATKKASMMFVEAVIKDYPVWACEPTGESFTVYRERIE